jgi:hypothetical protein
VSYLKRHSSLLPPWKHPRRHRSSALHMYTTFWGLGVASSTLVQT